MVRIEWVRWTFCDNVMSCLSFLSQHNAGLAFLLLIHALSFYTLSNSSTVMYPSLSDPRKFCLLTFPLTFDWTVPPGHPIVGETASIRSSRCWALNKFLPWRLIRNWLLDHYVTVVGHQIGKWTRWPAYLLPLLPLDSKKHNTPSISWSSQILQECIHFFVVLLAKVSICLRLSVPEVHLRCTGLRGAAFISVVLLPSTFMTMDDISVH